MRPFKSLAFIGVISASLLVPTLYAQNPPTSSNQSGSGQQGQRQPQKPPLTKAQREKAKKELDNAYKDWLDMDVAWIITDAERDAFLRLSTNEEREQFIEQFWLRRDPTPDTPENEFKEEHYRRIAYANEHFASGVPGWKTDRGRIYIIWGKPDTMDQHPTGGFYNRTPKEGGGETSTFPFEDWTYNYLPGLGNNVTLEFVDACGCNEYRLETDPEAKDALLWVPGAGLSDLEDRALRTSRSALRAVMELSCRLPCMTLPDRRRNSSGTNSPRKFSWRLLRKTRNWKPWSRPESFAISFLLTTVSIISGSPTTQSVCQSRFRLPTVS